MKKTILAMTTAIFLLAACGKKEQPAARADNSTAGTGRPKAAAAYAKKGTYFKLPGVAGGEIDLAAYAGKPVIVFFFAEWCPFCNKAAPFLEKTYRTYKARSLQLIGIDTENDKRSAIVFAENHGLTFPVAYNGGEAARRYKTRGVPYIFLLTKEHTVYRFWPGYDESFDKEILKAIEEVI